MDGKTLLRRSHGLRYAIVGAICTAFHLATFLLLLAVLQPHVANAVAFAIAMQVNFLLSYRWTWSARTGHCSDATRAVLWRLLAFNASGVAVLALNSLSYWTSVAALHLGPVPAAVLALVVSSSAAYVLSSRLLFAVRRPPIVAAVEGDASGAGCAPSVPGTALFLPAHNEAGNLRHVVSEAIDFLASRHEPYRVIIVDDGSSDSTFAEACELRRTHPEHVVVIRHERNMGYGAALRTGFSAGLETGLCWVAFCDADRQFAPCDLGRLLDAADAAMADIVIGYRVERADGLKRRVMGRAWHLLSRLVLGYKAIDVDCGFKLFRREALVQLQPQLTGDHATISPEILARAQRAGCTLVEVGVNHYPRGDGDQTGADIHVILESLRGLVQVRRVIDLDRGTTAFVPLDGIRQDVDGTRGEAVA